MVDIMSEKLYRLLYPMRVVLIGCGNKEKPNAMAAAWCFPLSAQPVLFGVAVAKKRYSYGLIRENKEFTINLPGKGMEEITMYCGTESGREVNKFGRNDLSEEYGKLSAPMVKECYVSLECKLVEEIETGDHVTLVGEVVNVVKRREEKGLYYKNNEFIGL